MISPHSEYGLGDKCELTVGSLQVAGGGEQVGLPVPTGEEKVIEGVVWQEWKVHLSGDVWNIGFRTWGGDGCGPSGCDTNLRTAVEAAACGCDIENPLAIGGWDQPHLDCNTSVCPLAGHTDVDNRLAWNPIGAPEMDAKEIDYDPQDPRLVPLYPIHSTSADYAEIDAHQLVRDRHVGFTRFEPVNRHDLTWSWIDAPKFRSPGDTVDYHVDAEPGEYRTTRIRLAWPNYPMPESSPLPEDQYTLSDEQEIDQPTLYYFWRVKPLPAAPAPHIRTVLPGRPIRDLVQGGPRPSPLNAPGFILAHQVEPEQTYLLPLGRRVPRVVDIRPVVYSGPAPSSQAPMVGLTGSLDSDLVPLGPAGEGLVPALVVYQEADQSTPATGAPAPARLYFGRLEARDGDDEPITLHESTTLIGDSSAPPNPGDAQVVLVEGTGELLLLGNAPGGDGGLSVRRLRLASGTWSSPVTLLPRSVSGFCARLDEQRNQVVVFDGAAPGGAAVHLLDLVHLTLHTLSAQIPPELSRAGATCDFDPTRRLLYVYGGRAPDGTPRTDAWRLRLSSRSWTLLGDGAEPEGPGALVETFTFHDGERLWVTPLDVPVLGAARVPLHALGADGTWLATDLWRKETGVASYPVTGTLLGGLPERYRFPVDDGAPWPGPLALATLQGAPGELGLEVTWPSGDRQADGLTSAPGLAEAAFRCPPGAACGLVVKRRAGAGPAPFSLSARPAVLVAAGEVGLAGRGRGAVLLPRERLAAVSAGGLAVMDAESLQPIAALRGARIGGATGVARCGAHLCVSRLGFRGLVVVDVRDPSAPATLHPSVPIPVGRDVASWGARAFVAHGVLGLARYTVSDTAAPTLAEWAWPGGRIVSVAAAPPLVAATAADGRVHLYDASESTLRRVGLVRADHRVDRVRFRGELLWVRHRTGNTVEVHDVSDPAQPTLLATFPDTQGELEALYRGPWRYRIQGRRLLREEAEEAAP